MTEDNDKPEPRRPKKIVHRRRVMIYMPEGLYRELARVADGTGVPLSEVGRRALRAGLKEAESALTELHGWEDTS